jgi:hypothetical protein
MLHTETITLHTLLRGTLTHDGQERDAQLAIAGIGTNEGELWRVGQITSEQDRKEHGLRPLEVINLEVPDEFGSRLVSFFARYIQNRQVWGAYNCHRFAFWMTGSPRVEEEGYLDETPEIQDILFDGL